jgi:hypothetical protein
MTRDAKLDPVYVANLTELRGDVVHGLKTDGTFATVRIPALDNVLRVVDELLQALADTRDENQRLFVDYSTEKSRRELMEDAFNETRTARDRLRTELADTRQQLDEATAKLTAALRTVATADQLALTSTHLQNELTGVRERYEWMLRDRDRWREEYLRAAGPTRPRPDATLAADMCPRCKGDNEEAWALCQSCAETKQQGHDTTTSEQD